MNRIIVDRVNIFDPNFKEHENQNMEEIKDPQKQMQETVKLSKSKKSAKKAQDDTINLNNIVLNAKYLYEDVFFDI